MPFLPTNLQCQSTEGTQRIRIMDKTLEFSSTVLPALSPYRTTEAEVSRKPSYTGGSASGSSGWGGTERLSIGIETIPPSGESYPLEGIIWYGGVVASGAGRSLWRRDISNSAAVRNLAVAAMRGAVLRCDGRRDSRKLRFCRRRVLACHFLNVRSRFTSSSSATPKNLATLCFADLQRQKFRSQTVSLSDPCQPFVRSDCPGLAQDSQKWGDKKERDAKGRAVGFWHGRQLAPSPPAVVWGVL